MPEFELIVKESNPDIIGVSKVLPKNTNRKIYAEEFNIKGYDMIPHENLIINKGRGSAMYIKKGIDYKRVYFEPKNGYFEEGIYLEVNTSKKEKLLCANIYRRGESDTEVNNNLLEIMKDISNKNYNHINITGDFNLKEINWENMTTSITDPDSYENRFIECVRDCYFTQHILEATRQRGTDKPTCLDLLFTNDENLIENIEIMAPLGKSDHAIIKHTLNLHTDPAPPKIKIQYEKGDYEKIKNSLDEVDWGVELNKYPDDIEYQWNFFKNKLKMAEENFIPRKKVFINGKLNQKFSVPLDRANLKKIKRKNRLWGRVRKELASEEQKLQYNKLRNQIRRLTRKGKKLIEKNIAANSKSNPKAFWSYACQKLKTKSSIPDLIINDDADQPVYATSDDSKSEVLLNYFSSVFTHEPDGEELPFFEKREYAAALDNIIITEKQISDKLKNIKTNKSPGPDAIHPRVLHEIAPSIIKPLSVIFQTSIRVKQLPIEWKHANVSAIHKKGSRTTPKNYRPVSLTSVICKILESIIRDEIIKHMDANKLFSPNQFGFLAGRSTVLQLLKVMDIWTKILDEGGCLDAIYCDFMKAFDKVPHNRLLLKTEKYGITGNTLGWISSFLTGRTQQVVINKSKSGKAPVTSGIPQGSVLGPLLFVIYINDLPEVVDSFVYLFADDTKVFRQIHTDRDKKILQMYINNLLIWSSKWLLKFHPDKCVCMGVGYKNDNPLCYNMNGQELSNSLCEKDLGVLFDKSLKFDQHINSIINKANRNLGIVRKTFEYMDKSIFCFIFKGIIRPHLEFAAPVWSPHLDKHIDTIENVQRRATRLVPGLAKYEYSERLKILKLPTLTYRRARGDMITTFKIIHGGFDDSIKSMLPLSDNDLRSNEKNLYIEGSKKDIRKYNFTMRVRRLWNDLPGNVVNAKDVLKFEIALDEYWKDQDLKYNNHKAEIKLRYQPHDI